MCDCVTMCLRLSISVYLSTSLYVYLLHVMVPRHQTPLPLKSPSTLSPSWYTPIGEGTAGVSGCIGC
jgi:hypothetical protein